MSKSYSEEDKIKEISAELEEIKSLSAVILNSLYNDFNTINNKDIANSISILSNNIEKINMKLNEHISRLY